MFKARRLVVSLNSRPRVINKKTIAQAKHQQFPICHVPCPDVRARDVTVLFLLVYVVHLVIYDSGYVTPRHLLVLCDLH